MKSILKLGIAALLALTPAVAFAVGGNDFFFSSSASNPNAGTTVTASGAGVTAPLYIWVTSSIGTNDITPASTTLTAGGGPTGAAALNLNGTLTTTTGTTIGNLQIYNPSYVGNTAVSINRWSALTAPVVGGTTFTGLEANTAMIAPPPSNAVYPANTITGLSRTSVGDPNYFPAVVVPGGSTGGAWLLGQITFNVTATAGTSTLALSAGPLDITKSGPSATTVLTPQYTFGTGTVTVVPSVLNGDTNNDHVVNAQDYVNVVNNLGNTGPTGGPPNGPLGDTNPFDGVVNAQDYVNVLNNLGATGGAGSVAAVPEPSSIALLSIAGLALAGFARKNRRSA